MKRCLAWSTAPAPLVEPSHTHLFFPTPCGVFCGLTQPPIKNSLSATYRMASTPDTPDWSLLPDQPAEFFGLEGEFDANDLKRSYNRFLKKFKPEKAPDEFQRIRQAYESVERMLRYGFRPSVGPLGFTFGEGDTPRIFELTPAGPEEETVYHAGLGNGRGPASPTSGPTLLERLESQSLDEIIASFGAESTLKPRDVIHLAILRDARSSGTSTEFFDTLLAGLERYPSDPALIAVMGEHLNHSPVGSRLLKELRAIAKALRGPSFYPVTEAAWDRLVMALPFPRFRQALVDCELELPAGDSPHRAVFLAHLLQRAVWKADEAWVDEMLGVFDARMVDEVPRVLPDVEFAEALWKYVRDPVRLADDSPERQRFDQLLQNITGSSGEAAYADFLRFHVEVEQDEATWIEAFPVRIGEDSSSALNLYRRFEARVAGHLVEGLDRTDPLGDGQRLHVALRAMDEGIRGFSPTALVWEFFWHCRNCNARVPWAGIIAALVIVLLWIPLTLVFPVGSGRSQGAAQVNHPLALSISLMFGLGLAAGWWLSHPVREWVELRLVAIENRLASGLYRRKYRPALLGIFGRLRWGFDTSLRMLEYAKQEFRQQNLPPATLRMLDLWSRDLGVALVMTARRYLAP
jgi:hypothetical protein